MTPSRWAVRTMYATLTIICVIDCVLILQERKAESRVIQNGTSLSRTFERPAVLPVPDGFAQDLGRIDTIRGQQPGWVVRYATAGCEFCRDDKLWEQLAPRFQDLRYKVVVILPSSETDIPRNTSSNGASPEIAYVNLEWLRHIRLTLAPTLLIFGPSGRLLWSRQGTLLPGDAEAALQAIKTAN